MSSLLKRLLFRLHWICGITAGLVLAVVGVTGATIAFEAELLRALNPELHAVVATGTAHSPDVLIAATRAAYPDYTPRGIAWEGDADAVVVRMAKGRERGGLQVAVDPYSGKVLGTPRGAEFFEVAEQLHRTLAAGPVGKQIVGASTACLVLMALSGLWLRWLRRPRSLSGWFRVDFRLRGRAFLWQLHAVTGVWVLVFYLVAALTGLWWSYDFYRDAVNRMAGATTPTRRPPSDDAAAPIPLDRAWTAFRTGAPDATRATVALSAKTDTPVEIRYQTEASPHDRAWNTIKIDASSGDIVAREPYAELPRGRRFVSSLFPLHSGSFLGLPGRIAMALAALVMPLFTVTGIWVWIKRRRAKAARRPRDIAIASQRPLVQARAADTP